MNSLARSIVFYGKLFNAELVKVRRAYAKFDLAQPPLNFALNELAEDESAASLPSGSSTLCHLGKVASTEEVLAMRDEMKIECCYASQEKPAEASAASMVLSLPLISLSGPAVRVRLKLSANHSPRSGYSP